LQKNITLNLQNNHISFCDTEQEILFHFRSFGAIFGFAAVPAYENKVVAAGLEKRMDNQAMKEKQTI